MRIGQNLLGHFGGKKKGLIPISYGGEREKKKGSSSSSGRERMTPLEPVLPKN